MPNTDGSSVRYPRILNAIHSTPWAILPEKLEAICEVAYLRARGDTFSDSEIQERIAAGPGSPGPYTSEQSVAVLPLYGVLMPRANIMTEMSGGTSLEKFQAALSAAANDPSIASILIDVDSPGGSVSQVVETAALVREARKRKPVVAVANTMAASAAYWIASQASELHVSPSGSVGSIGVLASHDDESGAYEKAGIKTTLLSAGRYKTEGNPFGPLDDDARAALQSQIDAFYSMFVSDVAKGRGVKRGDVTSGFGEGRMVLAQDAVAEGMADSVATFSTVAQRLIAGDTKRRGARADADPLLPTDAGPEPVVAEATPEEPDEHDAQLLAEMRTTLEATTTALKEDR